MRAESLDISERGLYFATGSYFKEGELLEVRLRMPTEVAGFAQPNWRCIGHVVRTQPLDTSSRILGVALQFDDYQVLQEREPQPRLRTSFSKYVVEIP
jgi:hypothetical protein